MPAPNEWLGRAGAVAQVTTLTVTGVGTSTATLSTTVGPKLVPAVTANTMTPAAFAALLYAALTGSSEPEVQDANYSYVAGSAVVTATVRTPGLPVPFVGATAGGLTVTAANAATATGPNDIANVVNWSAAALPGAGAPGLVRSGPDLLHNLDTGAVASTVFDVVEGYNGNIGLPDRSPQGYSEYRPRRLRLAAAAVLTVDAPTSRVRAEFAGAAGKVYCKSTANPDGGTEGALDVDGAAALAELHVIGGSAVFNRDSGGGTAGAVHVTGGRLTILNNSPITSLKVDGGRCDVSANMAAVTLTQTGGEVHITGGSQQTWELTGGTLYAEFAQAAGSPVLVHAAGAGQGSTAPVVDFRPCPGSVRLKTGSWFTGGAVLRDPYGNTDSDGIVTFDQPSMLATVQVNGLGPTIDVDRT